MPPQHSPPIIIIAASGGSPGVVIDPVLRMYLECRWRALYTEMRAIAPLLGWSDRLPTKAS